MEMTIYTESEKMSLQDLHGANLFDLSAFLTDAAWNGRDKVVVAINGHPVLTVRDTNELKNGAKRSELVDTVRAIVTLLEETNVSREAF